MRKFNFSIEIDNNDNSLTKSIYKSRDQKSLVLEKYNFVDLNLPSGTLWAKYNIGVNPDKLEYDSDWSGNYYMWGELEEASEISFKKYIDNDRKLKKYCLSSKYGNVDNKTILELEDDIVYMSTKNDAFTQRIPNKTEAKELIDNTIKVFVNNYNNIKNLNVVIFKSKANDNELIVPLCGSVFNAERKSNYSYGGFWLANLFTEGNIGEEDDSEWSYALIANNEYKTVNVSNRKRIVGLPVRGILNN